MSIFKKIGEFITFVNGNTALSAANFNSVQKKVQTVLNQKIECSDIRISDANSDDGTYSGIYPVNANAINFPFDTSKIEMDKTDALLIVLIPYGRSCGIQVAYDAINKEFWLRNVLKTYVEYDSSKGTIYEIEPLDDWVKIISVSSDESGG